MNSIHIRSKNLLTRLCEQLIGDDEWLRPFIDRATASRQVLALQTSLSQRHINMPQDGMDRQLRQPRHVRKVTHRLTDQKIFPCVWANGRWEMTKRWLRPFIDRATPHVKCWRSKLLYRNPGRGYPGGVRCAWVAVRAGCGARGVRCARGAVRAGCGAMARSKEIKRSCLSK